ncbi:MAG: class I SAM-dependent methyltransferase [Nitriliruptorales bacterium]|nr:class I SAM-dependent methyltransferase [Nitriliruptorales bacterium]
MTSSEDVVQVARGEWELSAKGWDDHHRSLAEHGAPVQERMITLLAPERGESILELAGGLGDLSRQLAAAVGPDGTVLCTDLAEGMIEAARERTPTDSPVTFRVMDAHDIDIEDDSVDAVVCKMGLMLTPDPDAVVAECRRVLRPGGRLVAATWGPMERNLWIATFGAAMLAHGHVPPGDPGEPGGIFSLSTPAALSEILERGGFDSVEAEVVAAPETVASFDAYWELRRDTSGPLTAVLQGLDDEEVTAIRATCEEYAAHLRADDGSYTFPGEAVVARAQ